MAVRTLDAVRASEELIELAAGQSGRQCGDCSLCCKLFRINEPSLSKKADAWCPHCKPGRGGCAVYDTRPGTCPAFACNWLMGLLPDYWRPSKCKMAVSFETDVQKVEPSGGEMLSCVSVEP